MQPKTKRLVWKLLLCVGIVAVCALLGSQIQDSALGIRVENSIYDLRFKLRGPLPPPQRSPITILAVDEASLERLDDPLMLWQKYFAEVVDRLVEARASAVGIDFIFIDITKWDADGKQKLLATLLKSGAEGVPVVLAYRVRADGPAPLPPEYTWAAGEEGSAYVNLTTDRDDFVRRQYIYQKNQEGTIAPGFAYAIAKNFCKSQGQTLPPAPGEELLINYRGLRPFQHVSFYRAYEAAQKNDLDFFKNHFNNRIVLIGAVGDDDLHSTPLYYLATQRPFRTPGIEIHANTIATLLEGNFIQQISWRHQMAVTVLVAALVALFCFRLTPVSAALCSLLLVVAYMLVTLYWAFARGWWLLVVSPVTAAVVAAGLSETSNFVLEGREKRRMRQLFKRYVNDQVIEKILETPESLALLGDKKHVTVLFSDIRDFTARSEKMPAEVLVTHLNRYFTAMVEAIQSNGGMVDKFIGDGIIALFGAPLDNPQSALQAVKAGQAMLAALGPFNESLVREKIEPIAIGIAIHTGQAIVGNIGSSQKMEYTAIGDVVNTASRIEGLNRTYNPKGGILISSDTYKALDGKIAAEYVGDELMKGKTKSVSIYRVLPAGAVPEQPATDLSQARSV